MKDNGIKENTMEKENILIHNLNKFMKVNLNKENLMGWEY